MYKDRGTQMMFITMFIIVKIALISKEGNCLINDGAFQLSSH